MTRQVNSWALPHSVGADFLHNKIFQCLVQPSHEFSPYKWTNTFDNPHLDYIILVPLQQIKICIKSNYVNYGFFINLPERQYNRTYQA